MSFRNAVFAMLFLAALTAIVAGGVGYTIGRLDELAAVASTRTPR